MSDEIMTDAPVPPEGAGSDARVIDGTTVHKVEDVAGYLQQKNPNIKLEECDGRTCVRAQDFFMTACNIGKEAATSRINYLKDNFRMTYDRVIKSKRGERGPRIPLITLEGAFELLLSMNTPLGDVMRRVSAKDSVDSIAATPGSVRNILRNQADPSREALRRSCEVRDANGEGQASIGGSGSSNATGADAELCLCDANSRVLKQRRLLMNELNENFLSTMRNIQQIESLLAHDNEANRVIPQIREQARNASLLHTAALLNASAADRSLVNPTAAIGNGGSGAAIQAAPSSASVPPAAVAVQPQMSNEFEPVTISVIMYSMGIRGDDLKDKASLVGRKVASMYREKYRKNPKEHKQFVNGAYVDVKSYTKRDEEMIKEAIRDVCASVIFT